MAARPPRQPRAPATRARARVPNPPNAPRRVQQRNASAAVLRVKSHDALASAKFGNSALSEVVAAFADPDNHPPQRLPGARKTFVNKLRSVEEFTGLATAAGLLANSGLVVAFRDPRCATVTYEYKGSGALSVYAVMPATAVITAAPTMIVTSAGEYMAFAHTDYTSGWDRHGSMFIPWKFKDGCTRIFVQSETGALASIAMSGLTATTLYTFSVSWYFAGKYQNDTISGTSDGTGLLTLALPAGRAGYIAVKCVIDTQCYMAIYDQSKNAYRHKMLHELDNQLPDVEAMRVNAVSAMWSDRTAEQFSQGNCVAYQASGSEEWSELIKATPTIDGTSALDPYSFVASFNDMHKGSFKKGRYLPLKPSDDPREQQYVQLGAEEQSIPAIDYKTLTDFIYIGWSAGVLTNAGATIGEITVVHAVEGVSESQWRATATCTKPRRVFDDATFVLAQLDADFENNKHLEKLWSFFKRIAPIAVGIAEQIAPSLPPNIGAPVMMGARAARQILPLLK